jgi:putative ABC transport system permease protein
VRLIPYHTRLAWRSLRRDPGLSATIVVVLAVAACIFSTALIHWLRLYGPRPALSPGLHQVEIGVDDRTLRLAYLGSNAAPIKLAPHTRVSYPNYQVLAASGIPARQMATFRSRLWIAAEGGGTAAACDGSFEMKQSHNARFVDGAFFTMFAPGLRWGSPWTHEDEAAGRPRAVLSRHLNAVLFDGADSTGKTVRVDGRPYVVSGVLAEDAPVNAEWDPAAAGGGQDAIYLPFAEHQRLQAWPETPYYVTPFGPHHEDLLKSDAVFVTFWVELETPAQIAAYQRYLAAELGPRGQRYQLRDLATWREMVKIPPSVISFFTQLTLIIFAGSGLIVARLLMAKGLVRGDELGVFRALGAPRGALFWRQIIEAAMLSGIAASLGTLFAVPQAEIYNRFVRDNDIPLRMSWLAVGLIFATTMAVGIGSALYPSWMVARRRPTVALGRA